MPVRVATRIGEALIWTAFALEFVIMISVVERKLKYCVQHWIDLLVIVLPLVGFLRTLRWPDWHGSISSAASRGSTACAVRCSAAARDGRGFTFGTRDPP